ncbi:hypothetical protein VTO73DRAFT_9185 [Trametes versicolor]
MLGNDTAVIPWIPLLEEGPDVLDGQAGDVRILLSSAALLYYDFLLTLPDEIRLAWQAPIRLATVLYLLVRYISLANMGLAVIIQTPESPVARLVTADVNCISLVKSASVMQIFLNAAVSAFVAARITALWSRNWYLGALLFLAGLLNWTPYIWQVIGFDIISAPWPLETCLAMATQTKTVALAV